MKRKPKSKCGVIGLWLYKVHPTQKQNVSRQHGKKRHISKNTLTESRVKCTF